MLSRCRRQGVGLTEGHAEGFASFFRGFCPVCDASTEKCIKLFYFCFSALITRDTSNMWATPIQSGGSRSASNAEIRFRWRSNGFHQWILERKNFARNTLLSGVAEWVEIQKCLETVCMCWEQDIVLCPAAIAWAMKIEHSILSPLAAGWAGTWTGLVADSVAGWLMSEGVPTGKSRLSSLCWEWKWEK